jgi:O-acetyl-ADP-ribose deacetylase (regulator of RNase III)
MPASPLCPFERRINRSTLHLFYCDITSLDVDVVVSSDDVDLSMGGGVSAALLRAGGVSLWREARTKAPIPLGGVAVTTAGQLRAKRVFHAAVLNQSSRELTTADLVATVTGKCLKLCDELGFESIAFPVLATGAARLPREESAVAMLLEAASHLRAETGLKNVVVALFPQQ